MVKNFRKSAAIKAPKEELLQVAVCRYLDFKHPNVMYTSDLSGIKLSIGSATKAAKVRSKRYKIPDLLILHPSNGYHGLILELKRSRDELYTKDGRFKKSPHIDEQAKSIAHLLSIGYYATFSCGLDDTIKHIDNYFKPWSCGDSSVYEDSFKPKI